MLSNEYIGYGTNRGQCICADSLELLKDMEDNSINLVITSPPFALQRKKEYGNQGQNEYVDWLCQFARLVYQKLREDGSFVIDIGGAYEKGQPTYSLYQFRALIKMCDEIGFHLAQPFYWHNPSALPSPIEWVNKKKLRAKTSVNTVWWLCKIPGCKADVRKVLTPYSDRMKKLIDAPDKYYTPKERPSGHDIGTGFGKDNGGAIPPNLLQISNSESNSQYLRYCKKFGIKGHPARFPIGIPDFFIKFLTDEGDLVVDIFGGSNTSGQAAEKLNRNWLSFELSKEYVAASVFRFADSAAEAKEAYDKILSGEFITVNRTEQLELDL